MSLLSKTSALCLWISLTCSVSLADDIRQSSTNNWLTEAETESLRLERLQTYLRGFDQPMWEIGQRYLHTFDAINEGNWQLADYHWDKIKVTLENGLMKRPARRANAEAIFLGQPWLVFSESLNSNDKEQIFQAFRMATHACMACHVAENVAFMNQQPMFRLIAE